MRATLLTLLLAGAAVAAPAPPPPKLAAELLVGTWDYEYGTYPNGVVVFNPNGTYLAKHHTGQGCCYYAGEWSVEGDTIVLLESHFDPVTGETPQGRTEYRYRMSMGNYPHLAGRSAGGTKVVLSNRLPLP